jgi:GAF domain-containing protein
MLMPRSENSGEPLSRERRRNRRELVIGRDIVAVSIGPGRTSGLILDVSEAGMGIQAFSPLKAGIREQLRWRFTSDDHWIVVTGEIAWSNTTDLAGVRFLDIADEDRAQISRYLQSSIAGASPSAGAGVTIETHLCTELHALLERTQTVTWARGAAIAVAFGDQFLCRASTGVAPKLGATIDMEKGLSAECLRTGEMAYCDDSDNDSRVDAELCQELGLRSAIAFPVKTAGRVIGVLLCLWSQPGGYTDNDIRQLTVTADQFARLLCTPPQKEK